MGFFGALTFVFSELFGADDSLRGQARALDGAADGVKISVAGLPPKAQQALDALDGLPAQLRRAQQLLLSAARAFGEAGADAKRIDLNGLDLLQGFVVLASGALPGALLRRNGKRALAKHRADIRRHLRILRELEANGASKQEIRARRKLLEKSQKALRLTKNDLKRLERAGMLPRVSAQGLRAASVIAGALGMGLPGTVLSAREWYWAAREGRSLRKAVGVQAYNRMIERGVHAGRGLPELRDLSPERARHADTLADSFKRTAGKRAAGAMPIVGAGADAAVLAADAKKFWDNPSIGNGATLAADALYGIGNIPHPATLIIGNGGGALIDGGKLVVDHADDVKDFVDDHVPDVTPWDGIAPW